MQSRSENTYLFLVNLEMTNKPYEKTSIPLEASAKFLVRG